MKSKISLSQFVLLLFCCRMLSSLVYIPGANDFNSYSETLLINIISTVLQAVLLIPAFILNNKFSDDNIVMSAQRLAGKFGGVTCVFYYLYLLFCAIVSLTGYEYYMVNTVYPDSPALLISGLLIFISAYAAFLGLEAVSRFSLFAALLLIAEIIIVFFSLSGQIEVVHLYPLNANINNITQGVMMKTAENSDLVLLLFLLPRIKGKRYKGVMFYLLLSLTVFEVLNFLVITVFGKLAETLMFPTFVLEIFTHIAVFKNTNIIHALPWTFITFIKITVYMIGINSILPQLLPKKIKAVNIPLNLILISLGTYMLTSNYDLFSQLYNYNIMFWVQVFLLTVIPVGLLFCRYCRDGNLLFLKK